MKNSTTSSHKNPAGSAQGTVSARPKTTEGPALRDWLDLRDRYLMAQARHQLYDQSLVIARGKEDLLWDVQGKQYIDCFSGIMVVNFGHCNDRINAAITAQLERLQHVSTFFLTEPLLELAERLAGLTPPGLQRSYFVNSGSEAVDGAIALARAHTGNEALFVARRAYHGRTQLAAACTNVAPGGRVDPRAASLGIHFFENAYCYRCAWNGRYPDCGIACAKAAAKSIAAALEAGGQPGLAGILVEPIQGVGGVIVQPKEFLEALADIAHRHHGLLIIDEVQSGFGRTGAVLRSSALDLRPDIICLAKGIANGLSLGAYSATDTVGEAIRTPTFSTFGGNPLAAAAALAALQYMLDEDIPARAERAGARFRQGLAEMATRHELIGDIRGAGLFIGVEMVRDRESRIPAGPETLRILNHCRENGLVVGKSAPDSNVLRIGPPLVISDEHIDQALSILDEALTAVEVEGSGEN